MGNCMPRTKINKSKRRKQGVIRFIREDGILIELNNTIFEYSKLRTMTKKQNPEHKKMIFNLVNCNHYDPDDYYLKRYRELILLIHKKWDIDQWV